MKKTLGKRLLSGLTSSAIVLTNFLTVIPPNTIAATTETEYMTFEARVIFGDYNDDDVHEYNDPSLYAPQLQLLYRQGGTTGLVPDVADQTVTADLVVDDSEARKDWCYQYNYKWTVPVLEAGDNTTGYYVSISKNNQESAFNRDDYNVYFIPDIRFETGNIDNDPYKESAQHVFSNDDAIVYIFLDPKQDWQNKKADGTYNEPKTLDITMKKRYDGHNEGHINLHPNEKIEVQLQRKKDDGSWAAYKKENFPDQDYANWYYYETEENGEKFFVDTQNMITGTEAEIPADERFKISMNGQLVDYVIPNGGNKGKYIKKNSLIYGSKSVDSKNRLRIYIPIEECCDVTLTLDGDNHPQHFKNGYYYKWNSLPYGEYRVLETRSFIDNNKNDVYDEGEDTDTSDEYFYMVYPPSRDSTGVLHVQNYTKKTSLTISKKWFADTEAKEEISYDFLKGEDKLFDPVTKFEIYRSTSIGTPQKADDGTYYVLNKGDLEKVTSGETNEDGEPLTIEGDQMLTVDDRGAVFYYYVRENSGDTSIGINTNKDGFVKCGINDSYCVSYQDGDLRNIVLKNAPKMVIELKKEWEDISNPNKNDEINFTLYQSIYDYGDDVHEGDGCFTDSEGNKIELDEVGLYSTEGLTKNSLQKIRIKLQHIR